MAIVNSIEANTMPDDRATIDQAASTLAMVRHWQRVGPLLEERRRAELRAFDFAANHEIIDSLLDLGTLARSARMTSGLVEQQRLFQKWLR